MTIGFKSLEPEFIVACDRDGWKVQAKNLSARRKPALFVNVKDGMDFIKNLAEEHRLIFRKRGNDKFLLSAFKRAWFGFFISCDSTFFDLLIS